MYERIALGKNSFVVQSPTNVGLYRDGDRALLIDSGNDISAGRRLLKMLDEMGLRLKAVVTTHHHADHIGGNAVLQQRTGCEILAGREAVLFLSHPHLNPGLLYGGNPPRDLMGKFFLAQPSQARDIETADLPEGVRFMRLDGHAAGQYALGTPDGVWYLGDAVTGAHVLEKYAVSYIYDVRKFLESLDRLEEMQGKWFVPAHAAPVEDIRPLVRKNREKTWEILDGIAAVCRATTPFEEVLRQVFRHYELQMNIAQYALVGSTVRAYLAYLRDEGRMEIEFDDGRMLWRTK